MLCVVASFSVTRASIEWDDLKIHSCKKVYICRCHFLTAAEETFFPGTLTEEARQGVYNKRLVDAKKQVYYLRNSLPLQLLMSHKDRRSLNFWDRSLHYS
jgi:hypothetical protein